MPSPRSGIRLSSESLFSCEAARSQIGKLIILGEKSDRSVFLTGICVLIRVRASCLTEANNEPHAEAAAASASHPRGTNAYLLCHRPPDSGPHLGLVVMHQEFDDGGSHHMAALSSHESGRHADQKQLELLWCLLSYDSWT